MGELGTETREGSLVVKYGPQLTACKESDFSPILQETEFSQHLNKEEADYPRAYRKDLPIP